ncbi:hypothetical protein AYO38_02985 [bacterium SCGC AG-212-C10]|nr:hypothetical protein AYO38_02985 [bacterium SCGC AG-212-C10]
MILFTTDKDFLIEGALRQASFSQFPGIIYAQQKEVSVARCVDDLTLIGLAGRSEDIEGKVVHLPLR